MNEEEVFFKNSYDAWLFRNLERMDFSKNIKIDLRKYGISEQSVIVKEHKKSSKLCLFRENSLTYKTLKNK